MISFPMNDTDEMAKQLRLRIRQIMRTLRAAHPWPPATYSEGGFFRIPINIGGKPHEMPLGFVGSSGCSWARSGGCTMCDYGGFEGQISDDLLVHQAIKLLDSWPGETEINLSSLGSFFDDKELRPSARNGILAEVSSRAHIELIGVESRAVDITPGKIQGAKSVLGSHCCLEVGMGFESANDFVRNVCINKGLKRATFERAVKTIHDSGAHAVGHVLFKPPFLAESEAIVDAKATIEYLNTLGVRRIVLMACNVKERTLVGELYKRGLYRPPWLWSVLETALTVSESARRKLLIYGFKCGLPMSATSSNCGNCDCTIIDKIDEFCGTSDSSCLRTVIDLHCTCREVWAKECNAVEYLSLLERVDLYSKKLVAHSSN
jgi:radical SAM enzyme (TIGR01210 family)